MCRRASGKQLTGVHALTEAGCLLGTVNAGVERFHARGVTNDESGAGVNDSGGRVDSGLAVDGDSVEVYLPVALLDRDRQQMSKSFGTEH